jgi:hypothetical protein
MKLPRNVQILGWVIVVSHTIGVIANLVSLTSGNPTYSPQLWATFAALKLLGVISGVLLLRGLRVGAWLFLISLLVGMAIALAFTGPYSAVLWISAGSIAFALAGLGYFFIRKDWALLRSLHFGFGI